MAKKSKKTAENTIAEHRRARHEYLILDQFEVGLELKGWEVKSIRQGRVQLSESYILLKAGEAWLFNAHISPLAQACSFDSLDPYRSRKCLLHSKELKKLLGAVKEKGLTVVPLVMYWKNRWIKLKISLAKGKKLHDKRATEKERTWKREAAQLHKIKF
jgi:SsrA-binding protein